MRASRATKKILVTGGAGHIGSVPDFTILEAPVGKDPDQRDYMVSNAKIEAAGFAPSWPLARGLAEHIKGYQVVRRNQFGNG